MREGGMQQAALAAMAAMTQSTTPTNPDEEIVGPIILVDESLPQIISLLEKYSKKMVLRTQTLPLLKINFNSTETLTRAKAILALESLLAINGVAIIPQGDDFLKAIPTATATLESPPLYIDSTLAVAPTERIIARLFSLKNTTVQVIEPALQALVNKTRGGSVIVMPTANAVLFTDSIAAVHKAEKIVEQLDAPNTVMFFPVKNVRASDVMKQLKTLQQGGLKNILSGDIAIEADDLVNQLLIVTPSQNEQKLKDIIAKIDVESAPNTTSELIGLKHADAATVVSVLENLVKGSSSIQLPTNRRISGFGTTSASSTSGSNQSRIQSFSTRTNVAGGSTTAARTGQAAQPVVSTTKETPNSFSDYLTVVADERSNSLVVFGTPFDIKQVKDIIKNVDVPLAQVRIEVVVVEVTLGNQDASGLSTLGLGYKTTAASGSVVADGTYRFNTNAPSLPGGDVPFSITGSVSDLSLQMLFNKAENDSRVRILSAPLLGTSHNQEASVNIGQERPIITGTSVSSQSIDTTSSVIERQKFGIQLKVLPRVGSDGSVEMDIAQKIDTITGSTTIDGNDQPITANREAVSYLTAKHGETIVLAGLQSYNETTSSGKVWFFGYIPILGKLFSPKTNDEERTEIIIFLKPHVIDKHPQSLDETPGMQPGALTRVDAQSYIKTGRISAVSLTPEEYDALEKIRHIQEERAKQNREYTSEVKMIEQSGSTVAVPQNPSAPNSPTSTTPAADNKPQEN
jgi:general secretion pathway protein D